VQKVRSGEDDCGVNKREMTRMNMNDMNDMNWGWSERELGAGVRVADGSTHAGRVRALGRGRSR
jgi:hypothetical protein